MFFTDWTSVMLFFIHKSLSTLTSCKLSIVRMPIVERVIAFVMMRWEWLLKLRGLHLHTLIHCIILIGVSKVFLSFLVTSLTLIFSILSGIWRTSVTSNTHKIFITTGWVCLGYIWLLLIYKCSLSLFFF